MKNSSRLLLTSRILTLLSVIGFSAACGTDSSKRDAAKQEQTNSSDGTSLSGNEPAKGAAAANKGISETGGNRPVSSKKLLDPRFPLGNICTMSRRALESAGILPYTGPAIDIGIGEEHSAPEINLTDATAGATSPPGQGVPPPEEITETIDGIRYSIFYTTEASCKTKIRAKALDFSGEQNSMALQENLYNGLCQKGPQPESVSNGGPAKSLPTPNFSARQFWKGFAIRKCVETQLKHYIDPDGNEVVFGQVGGSVEPKR